MQNWNFSGMYFFLRFLFFKLSLAGVSHGHGIKPRIPLNRERYDVCITNLKYNFVDFGFAILETTQLQTQDKLCNSWFMSYVLPFNTKQGFSTTKSGNVSIKTAFLKMTTAFTICFLQHLFTGSHYIQPFRLSIHW